MPSIVDQLVSMGNDLLTKGVGVKEALAAILKQPFSSKLLSLRFDSIDGTLASIGTRPLKTPYAVSKSSLIPVLAQDNHNEKRFLFSMNQSQWDVLTAFSAGPYSWFTMVSLDTSLPASTPLKSGLFKVADYFTEQCKIKIFSYLTEISALCTGTSSSFSDTAPEQELLDKLTSFTSDIQSIMLFNENGSLLFKSGHATPPEELAHSLIELHHRSNISHPTANFTAPFTGITLSHEDYTVEIGKIRDTNCFIMLTVCGENAASTSRFIKTIALDAFFERLKNFGTIGEVKRLPISSHGRLQNSWFLPPVIVPQGAFAAIIGASDFHTPFCCALNKAGDDQILWFQTRSEALQHRLRPCPACAP